MMQISMTDSILSYQIRFQNTGTDTAFTVLNKDTLDADLDVRTIVPGPSSHPYTATISDGNILELLFENILLPDSFVNEPASNGFVFFDINLHSNPAYGTRVENRAAIFFDFNPPIITNTVANTVQMITKTNDFERPIPMSLHPNPVTDQFLLKYTLPENGKTTIAIYDLDGRMQRLVQVDKKDMEGPQQVWIQHLDVPSGVYTIQITTSNGESGILKFCCSEMNSLGTKKLNSKNL